MKINVPSIPEKGQTIALDSHQGWVKEMVREALPQLKPELDSIQGQVEIHRVNDNVSLSGQMSMKLHPTCDRCLEPFQQGLDVSIRMDLSSGPVSEGRDVITDEEEVELSTEDMEFSFYEGAEIDLKSILHELIVLALPIQFVCSEACKGLCPECGTNLNQKTCPCAKNKTGDLRWQVLKNIKFPDNRSS